MKQLTTLLALLVLTSCAWTSQLLERKSSGGQLNSVAVLGQVQGPATTQFVEKYEKAEDGTVRSSVDLERPVAIIPIRAEDGVLVTVRCPPDALELCLELEAGDLVKVGGLLDTPKEGTTLLATYIRRK